ncbi:MAG: elongation factor 4 [Ignavibacteriota bacterium]|jgi:GTP-binding protein LepA|nr:MAG: elongation factor 4 [Chlorobiota bacterium]MBE7476618.1 elongation factor 4 [Ignavibacteriales bacterium]MBL1123758.1 elongation factor 4 [Ignavibacteriota bacterium]MBV6420310.1 Elongation factor 4 [Ignavibacteriaceae bacterium]MCE7855645.1 elongation factor 4 [Ignavibacteria bacterium CHB3]MEB2296989.1 translation elongation factor 4 [Ignavibacteria bacterium]
MEQIRNFCIIAHIDHGKSTIADRLLEKTGAVTEREAKAQVLDDMDLERERGITIKSHAIQMHYKAKDGENYILNLIDTPGHVDFSYEVSRSLAACEGALLVVDAAQGVEAQTISNLYLALDAGLEIIPVLNKIDLPSAEVDRISHQVIDLIGCKEEDILKVSAKANIGIDELLEEIVKKIPPPKGDPNAPLQALIFDSKFDSYRGAIAFIRLFNGTIRTNDKIKFFIADKAMEAEEIGVLGLKKVKVDELSAGNVGYLIAGIKEVKLAKVGDTVTHAKNGAEKPLPGYKEVKPMVYSGLYPTDSDDYEGLRDALEKFRLNDSALIYQPETSAALGFGFRCGFLGLLHMEIVQERLHREYNQTIITTLPNVEYQVYNKRGEKLVVDNPAEMPPIGEIEMIEEPYIKAQIVTPSEFVGNIMKLSMDKRGTYKNTTYLDPTRADLQFEFPLSEIIFDFYDKLKSTTRGYASFDYEYIGYRESDLVKLDILLNGDPVDALSMIVHRDKAYDWGRKVCNKLKDLIPRQMFEVSIQAAIGTKVISKSVVKALRKNVLAKCYGGDITRKRKLLEKQKEGKKKMKQVGNVEIPQEAFLAVLQIEE